MKTSNTLALTLPFTFGVICASFLTGILPIEPDSIILPLQLSLALTLMFLVLCFCFKDIRPCIPMLFCAGLFCYWNSAIMPEGVGETGITGTLLAIKGRLLIFIDSCGSLSLESRSLLRALLLGDKSLLPRGIAASFRAAGASHVLALSGLHLGVISSVLGAVLRPLTGKSPVGVALRGWVIFSVSAIYTMMCGAGASLVRALIFIGMSQLRKMLPWRSQSRAEILCLSCAIQLCLSPQSVESLAFQYSYLAMMGLMLLHPLVARWYPGKLWSMLSLSICCQAFTAPLTYALQGSAPRHFLLSNLIALPLAEAFIPLGLFVLLMPENSIPALWGGKVCNMMCRALLYSMKIIAGM